MSLLVGNGSTASPEQVRIEYLTNEVMEGHKRMWQIKRKIKAAYKYDKPEFHRVSARVPEGGEGVQTGS